MIVYRSMYDGSARVPTTTVIANQSADWCGNPFSKGFDFLSISVESAYTKGKRIATPACALVRNDSKREAWCVKLTILHGERFGAINDHLPAWKLFTLL